MWLTAVSFGRQTRSARASPMLERQRLPNFPLVAQKAANSVHGWNSAGDTLAVLGQAVAYSLAAPGMDSGWRRGADPPERACSVDRAGPLACSFGRNVAGMPRRSKLQTSFRL